jgi:hypothetical protein
MEPILAIDELPTGKYEIMSYESYLTDKATRYIITAKDTNGFIVNFWANTLLADYIQIKDIEKTFIFHNEQIPKSHIRILNKTTTR